HQLTDAHTRVQQRLDEHQVAGLPGSPDCFVIPADLIFGGYVRQPLWRPRDNNPELGTELTKDLPQIRVVRPLAPERRRQLVSLSLGRRAPLDQRLDGTHAA